MEIVFSEGVGPRELSLVLEADAGATEKIDGLRFMVVRLSGGKNLAKRGNLGPVFFRPRAGLLGLAAPT